MISSSDLPGRFLNSKIASGEQAQNAESKEVQDIAEAYILELETTVQRQALEIAKLRSALQLLKDQTSE